MLTTGKNQAYEALSNDKIIDESILKKSKIIERALERLQTETRNSDHISCEHTDFSNHGNHTSS